MSTSDTKTRTARQNGRAANQDPLLQLLAPDQLPGRFSPGQDVEKPRLRLRLDAELLRLLQTH